jgi:hypothetical protein
MIGFDLIYFTVVLLSLSATLLILVPLAGSIVRLRANYNPKGLQLDEDGVVHPYTGPQVTSFFGMLVRVKRIEVSPSHQQESSIR